MNETRIEIDNKYTVIHSNGVGLRAERYGQPWRDLTGDGLVLAMAQEIEELRARLNVRQKEIESPVFSSVVIHKGDGFEKVLSSMDSQLQNWTMKAARMECSWICSDCCMTFPKGMPDACEHGHQGCTDIIQRDKKEANEQLNAGRNDA